MEAVSVMDVKEGDIIAETADSKTRVQIVLPRADIRKTVGRNGKPITIVHQEPYRAECRTQPNHVHLSTDRGVWCLNRAVILYRD